MFFANIYEEQKGEIWRKLPKPSLSRINLGFHANLNEVKLEDFIRIFKSKDFFADLLSIEYETRLSLVEMFINKYYLEKLSDNIDSKESRALKFAINFYFDDAMFRIYALWCRIAQILNFSYGEVEDEEKVDLGWVEKFKNKNSHTRNIFDAYSSIKQHIKNFRHAKTHRLSPRIEGFGGIATRFDRERNEYIIDKVKEYTANELEEIINKCYESTVKAIEELYLLWQEEKQRRNIK